jgi:hypothetical protein
MDDDNRAFAPCPTCGNDDIDSLVWDDPDGWNGFVLCLACGTLYNPMTGEERRLPDLPDRTPRLLSLKTNSVPFTNARSTPGRWRSDARP